MLIYEYKLSGSNKLNILAKALDGTLGHRETDERVS